MVQKKEIKSWIVSPKRGEENLTTTGDKSPLLKKPKQVSKEKEKESKGGRGELEGNVPSPAKPAEGTFASSCDAMSTELPKRKVRRVRWSAEEKIAE